MPQGPHHLPGLLCRSPWLGPGPSLCGDADRSLCQRDGHRPPTPRGPEINGEPLSLAATVGEG